MPSSRAPGPLLVALATLALAVLLYPGALVWGEAFFERDLHLDWYPRMAALARALAERAWPLWDPGLGFGQPLLADPSVQVLYPVTWLALALPWAAAYTGFVLVHLVIASTGAFRLAVRLGAGRSGALVAALVFVLSGPVQSALNLWHHFAGTAWMPWVLLAVDGCVRRPSIFAALGLATALALQVLAGSADLCAMTLALAFGVTLVRLIARRHNGAAAPRALASLLGALGLAAALTSALWWPAAEVVSRSSRRELPLDVRTAWSIPSLGLARLALPLDPARVPFEPGLWQRLYDRPVSPLIFSAYLGLPALALAGAALVTPLRRRRALGLAAVLLLAVAFAMGPHGPLYGPLAAVLPPLRIFRYPSKALLVAALALALLAGLGFRALARGAVGRSRLTLAGALAAATLVASLGAARLGARPGWSPALAAGAAAVLLLDPRRVRPALAAGALAALAVADLTAAHRELNATAPAALLVTPPPVVALVRQDDGRRLHVFDYHTLPGTAERLLGRSDPYRPAGGPPGLDRRVLAFVAQRQLLVPPTASFFGLETSYDLDNRGLYPRDLNDLTFFLRRVEGTPVHARLLRMGAVARVVALHASGLEDLTLERTLPSLVGDEIRVLRVPDPQPRAWLVARTRLADGEAAFRVLLDPSFEPRDEAIVASGPALAGAAGPAGAVRWMIRRSDRQRLETTSDGPALLVLADAYDPGWRATVDGAPAVLVRANVAFRGVAVPAGRHAVELVYRPRAVLGGAVISAAGLVSVALLAVAGARRARRQRS